MKLNLDIYSRRGVQQYFEFYSYGTLDDLEIYLPAVSRRELMKEVELLKRRDLLVQIGIAPKRRAGTKALVIYQYKDHFETTAIKKIKNQVIYEKQKQENKKADENIKIRQICLKQIDLKITVLKNKISTSAGNANDVLQSILKIFEDVKNGKI